jgi:hypothetical protein
MTLSLSLSLKLKDQLISVHVSAIDEIKKTKLVVSMDHFFFCFRMRAGFMGERAVLRVSIFALQSFAQPDRAMFALSRLHQIGKMVRPTIRRSQEERLHHDPLIVLFGFLRSRGEFCVCERRRPTTSAGPEAHQATPAAGPILNVGSER